MNEDQFAQLLESTREGGAILRGDKAPSRRFEIDEFDGLAKQPLETDWERLDAMTDEDIDLSDIPEITPEMFARMVVRRPPESSSNQQEVTLDHPDTNLDITIAILPDLLADELDIVFCGTAASSVSAKRGAYYAGPGNMFWSTLHEVGLTPRLLQPEEYREILNFGLGLTDLVKAVSGNDSGLRPDDFDRPQLRETILHYQPRIVAFTSKRAASEFFGRPVEYGLQPEQVGSSALFVLSSPSGAARRWWDVVHWQELARIRARFHE